MNIIKWKANVAFLEDGTSILKSMISNNILLFNKEDTVLIDEIEFINAYTAYHYHYSKYCLVLINNTGKRKTIIPLTELTKYGGYSEMASRYSVTVK